VQFLISENSGENMHHYPFHVGDYASHTQHLDELEDLAYRRMLDFIYLNETNLPESVDEIARLIRMRTHSERIATVLREFFTLENGEWINKRASLEIVKYQAKSDKAKESASKRWAKPDANALPTHSERNANQNQNQNQNQQDKDINTLPAKAVSVVKQSNGLALLSGIDNLPEQVAEDFLKVRKAKRSPLTATALALIEREAVKAGLTTAQAIAIAAARGWQSFKADWIADNDGKTTAERTQDFKDRQAEKAYAPLLDMTPEERAAWGFK
jgi:uncharacterized protein YdaU (DUF1376 family)